MSPRKKQPADQWSASTDESGRLRVGSSPLLRESDVVPDDEEQTGDGAVGSTFTANQVVAYNMQRARKARGWNQDYLGERLERITGRQWSRASVSAAESSWRGGRARRFDANEILALAVIFDLSMASFFVPPSEDELLDAVFVADVLSEVAIPTISRDALIRLTGSAQNPTIAGDKGVTLQMTSEAIDLLVSELRKQGLVYGHEERG